MRILFISDWFPMPPNNGAKLRAYNAVRRLGAGHDVALVAFAAEGEKVDAGGLHPWCRSVEVVRQRTLAPRGLSAGLALLSRAPRAIAAAYSSEMEGVLRHTIAAFRPDVVVAFHLQSAVQCAAVWRGPAVCEEVQLGVLHDQYRRAPTAKQRLRFGLTWLKHRRFLARLLRHFDACTVPSEEERRLLAAAAPGYHRVAVIPNGLDLSDYDCGTVPPRADTIIFCGSCRYFANFDAARWFLSDVYPLIQQRAAAVRLTITGAAGVEPLPAAAGVECTGQVADVRPLVASSWISVVPLRIGSGTRLKILESMALGTPVVSTSKGAEGLAVAPGRHLLIADGAAEFAEHVLSLLRDGAQRARLATAARALVEDRYDWRHLGGEFEELVRAVADGRAHEAAESRQSTRGA